MRNYELTERGKLFIALFIIALLCIAVTAILISWALERGAASYERRTGSRETVQNGTISQNGGDGEIYIPDPTLADPLEFDFEAGTMTFLFTPSLQTVLNDNTITMIGTFLLSPQNTGDAQIAVGIPHLSDEDMAIITTAILNAFSIYYVQLSDMFFYVYYPETDAQTFYINLSFR